MRTVVRKYCKKTKLETIYEDHEFLVGPYPQETFYASGFQLVTDWAEQIFPCWFAGHEDVCAWRV
jgi:hypothetical protein